MYRHCLFCAADLGANESIEVFPVGRRLAFDASAGRLWVVCRACSRWNLSPLEERWEAIETCERSFQSTRTRVSTEHIGLARLREGLELVRVGKPLRPEFAAWRYGDQFGRRRRNYVLRLAAGTAMTGAAVVGSATGVIALVALQAVHLGYDIYRDRKNATIRIPLVSGKQLTFPSLNVGGVHIRSAKNETGWEVSLPENNLRIPVLVGTDALRTLQIAMPHINLMGSSARKVQAAVREIEDLGDAQSYLAAADERARKAGYPHLSQYPAPLRLAVEMAANEERERQALEGELALLEQDWKEAEEIAQIADNLTLPKGVADAFARFKKPVKP